MIDDCINDNVEQNNKLKNYIIRDPGADDAGYNAFSQRAVFKNYVGQHLAVMVGSANLKDYSLTGVGGGDLPETLSHVEVDFSGVGVGYSDSLRQRQRDVFSKGRCGAWVQVNGDNTGRSIADRIPATCKHIEPHQIEDWSEMVINGKKKLNYVKFREAFETVKRENGQFVRKQYNVIYELFLDEEGLYAVEVDDQSNNNEKLYYEPKLGNGQRLDYIPFQFYGSEQNTPDVDVVPCFKLSRINIALYNEDANVRQTTHFFGAPMATFSLDQDVDPETFKKINGLKDGETPAFGTARGYVGCTVELVQSGLDSIMLQVIKDDIDAMWHLGSQHLTVGQNETAEAARIRKSSGMANLSDMTENIEQGDKNVLTWISEFNSSTGQAEEFELKLNRVFYDEKITPELLNTLKGFYQEGLYPFDDLYKQLKDANVTSKEDAEQFKESLGMDITGRSINPEIEDEE